MVNGQLLWYLARGSGIVAYILLTLSVVLGVLVSRRWHSARWPRFAVHEAHRLTTLTCYCFLAVHVLTILLDSFVHFSVLDVLVPFVTGYRTLWTSLGIISAELALALGASVWVRDRIGYRTWHLLHGLSYPVFFLALLHGLGTGSDTGTTWMTVIYGGSALAVVGATAWRFAQTPRSRYLALAGSGAGILAVLAFVVMR